MHCSRLSLIPPVVYNEKIENHFLDLQQLKRCNAENIFGTIKDFLNKESINISRIIFTGMDGFGTMSGEHNGVECYFNCSHNIYIHCRNH